ncbi:MAG: winged helix DNA-binding domain-containing protein [Acidimicrobiales bacterium]
MTAPREITDRQINRAFLARQLLIERSPLSPLQAVEHLVGMQSQHPDPAYIGLWTRLKEFRFDDLSDLILERKVVRIALMRDTLHLVSAEDALALRPLLQGLMERRFRSVSWGKNLQGLDLDPVISAAKRIVDAEAVTLAALGEMLAPLWPDRDPGALAHAARNHLALVQVPPRGVWGMSGPARHMSLDGWLKPGRTKKPKSSMADLVLRYLRAFGPASVADIQSWCGLSGIGKVIQGLSESRKDLVVLVDQKGTELFDVADAPRPDPDTVVPVRLLPMWDNALLSHKDRRRILGPVDRTTFFTNNGIIPGTVLVDGYVRAVWTIEPGRRNEPAIIRVDPLLQISKANRRTIDLEAGQLLEVLAPGKDRKVTYGDS